MPPVARVRPTPNWSPVWTTLSSWNCISRIFSLITGVSVSSVSVVMIFFEAASITSPVEGYAYRPSIVNVIQPGSSRTLMLANCVGGMTVVSNTCRCWLSPSVTQIFRSSGVSPSVTRAAVAFDWPLLKTSHFNAMKFLSRGNVAAPSNSFQPTRSQRSHFLFKDL